MTVLECEQQVLRLLDEVGVTDYADRMYRFIDEAQRVIACTWGFIRKRMRVTVADGEAVPLPADCFAVETVKGGHDFDVEPTEDGGLELVFAEGAGVYTVIYKAYPDPVTESDGGKRIQLAPEYHAALCCYVAALTQDNEYDKRAYQLFMERYNNEIALAERARQNNGRVKVVNLGRFV